MRKLTTTGLTAVILLGTSAMAAAGPFSGLKDKVKDAAVNQAEDVAKDKISAPAEEEAVQEGVPAEAKTGAIDSVTSKTLTTDESFKAGKIILKGGSTTDAAIAIGKDRIKAQGKQMINNQAESLQNKENSAPGEPDAMMSSEGIAVPSASVPSTSTPSAPALAAPINCPDGTTAQPNGTCMMTGDWK